ncbi:hypothetical protein GWP43_05125 [Treponema vincentii]|uniref:Transposase/invertase (TIGR01784 family) n=1 Tax=Treponema vincentii TaxID=69710 RepID=A0A6P1Y4P9_9SPIR|nr:hypothetical protein GWP43_05125 [Treponema vincentii]
MTVDAVDAPYIFKREEVRNILIAEYDYDTDIAVQRQESLMLGIQQGEARCSRQKALETAKTMLTMHYPFEDICKISGLSPEEVRSISNL